VTVKAYAFLCLILALVANAHGQDQYHDQFKDAGALLDAVGRVYAAGMDSFHFESVTETASSDEWQRNWQKEVRVAIKAPMHRYRMESRSAFGTWTQVSDGTTEWVYFREANSYVKRPAESEPQFPRIFLMGMQGLRQAWDTATFLQADALHATNATLLRDETILLGGHSYPCYVVRAIIGGKGSNSDNTYWIEKKTLLFRKIVQHGQSIAMLAQDVKIPKPVEVTTTYPIAELHTQIEPDTFVFAPPADAKEVAAFQLDLHQLPPPPAAHAIGQPLPALSLTSAEGKEVKLSSFRGRPLLIDEWATWCAPCLEWMPRFGKLAAEMQAKGVAVISVDRDNTAEIATRYLAAHGFTWPNYHDRENKLESALGQKAIPLTLLVDAAGTITYMSNDADEAALRKAIESLNLSVIHTNP